MGFRAIPSKFDTNIAHDKEYLVCNFYQGLLSELWNMRE